jgi:hypothetical protein
MRQRFIPCTLGVAVAAGVLAPSPALAVGEQTGRIRGVVTNLESQEVLPGVMVVASGPALIGLPRTTMTTDQGRYEIASLPPGTYSVEFSYPGTVPLARAVTVRLGEAVSLNVAYGLQRQEVESVQLTERQLTKPDSAQTGVVRDSESFNRLPTGRSYQTIAQQVPGVSGGANPNIKGGTSRHNKYLIDGLDVTDPVTSTFAMNLTFDSTQAVDVITGGMDAEYNALGGVINVISRGGSDDFHSLASVYANHQKLSAQGSFGTNLYEGMQPFNETKVGPTQSYEASLNVGGPIIRRKLWYGFTYEFDYTGSSPVKSTPLGVPPYDIQHPARTYLGHALRLKLAYAPLPGHRVWLSASADPASISNGTGGNSSLGVAESHQNQGGVFSVLGWEWAMSDILTPALQVGFLYSYLETGPEGRLGDFDKTGCTKFSPINCTYDPRRARHINLVDNTTWYQGPSNQLDRRFRVQIDPSVRLRGNLLGFHNAKAGVQVQIIRHTWDYSIPGGSVFRDLSAAREGLEAGLCNTMTGAGCNLRIDTKPFNIVDGGYGVGFYVQDRWWTPLQWLTLTPGLRADYGYAYDWKGRKVSSLFALGPRFGATADLTRDGRNVLFGYYGRNTDPVTLLVTADTSSTEASHEWVRKWDPTTGDFSNLLSESGGPDGFRIAQNVKMPHSDEITVGARRELVPNTVGSIEYTWKRITNTWVSTEVNRIWDPTGSRVVGWVDPTKEGLDIFLNHTPDDPRWYQGVVVATEGRPTPNWDYGASYTLSWTYLRATPSNPRFTTVDQGFSSADLRHFVRAYGSYNIGRSLLLGGYFQYQSGTPMTKGFYNDFDGDYGNQRSPLGTTPSSPNDPTTISEFRTPDLVQLDLRLAYNVLPATMQHRLAVIVDVFNVFNLRTPTSVVSDDIARFGQVGGRQRPFRLQLGLSYAY